MSLTKAPLERACPRTLAASDSVFDEEPLALGGCPIHFQPRPWAMMLKAHSLRDQAEQNFPILSPTCTLSNVLFAPLIRSLGLLFWLGFVLLLLCGSRRLGRLSVWVGVRMCRFVPVGKIPSSVVSTVSCPKRALNLLIPVCARLSWSFVSQESDKSLTTFLSYLFSRL